MALYIFSFLEHSLTFFQRFPTYFPTFWQCMTSLYIMFPPSGNAWLCPRWMRSYKNGFRSTTGEWDTFSDLWQRMASFTERSRSLAMLHTFPALSGNVAPRFRSLAMLHNVSSSLWQCYITFLTSGNAWLCPRWIRSYKNGFRNIARGWDTFYTVKHATVLHARI